MQRHCSSAADQVMKACQPKQQASQGGAPSDQTESDLYLRQDLPPEMKNFPLWWLAKFWHTTTQHLSNLIESGALQCPFDIRNNGSSRAAIRVPRPFVLKFIQERKDLQAVADANPAPKPRHKS